MAYTAKNKASNTGNFQEAKLPPKTLPGKQLSLFTEFYPKVRFDKTRPIPELPVMVTIQGNIVGIRGGILGVMGEAKAGKSAVCDALLAAAINPSELEVDSFGIQVTQNKEKHAVLHFDTERGKYLHPVAMLRVLKRARLQDFPPHFESFDLKSFSVAEARKFIDEAFENMAKKHGGIHLVIIDGVGDLVNTVLDDEECNEVVKQIEILADKYECTIAVVLHFNPGTEKGRGHIGSQLGRKMEGGFIVEKDMKRKISVLKAEKFSRFNNGFEDVAIVWDDEKKMHVTADLQGPKAVEYKSKQEELEMQVKLFWDNIAGLLMPLGVKKVQNEVAEGYKQIADIGRNKALEIIAYIESQPQRELLVNGEPHKLIIDNQGKSKYFLIKPIRP